MLKLFTKLQTKPNPKPIFDALYVSAVTYLDDLAIVLAERDLRQLPPIEVFADRIELLREYATSPSETELIEALRTRAISIYRASITSDERRRILRELTKVYPLTATPSEIQTKLTWLLETLGDRPKDIALDHVSNLWHSNIRGVAYNGIFTHRQVHTFRSSLRASQEHQIQEAYHELVDFIDNYGVSINEALSPLEIFLITELANSILRTIRER